MKWAYPEFMWWWILIPVMGILLLWIQYRAEHIYQQWFKGNTQHKRRPILRYFLRFSGITLALLSLPGPFLGEGHPEGAILGKEVYFLVDVSASMNAPDIHPSRLKRVQQEISQLAKRLPGDRLGLIVYTQQAFVQCPLTDDQETFLTLLKLIDTRQFSGTGTDLRAGLSQALERFANDRPHADKPIGRAIILFTDGENFGENYTSVVNRLKAQQVTTLVVGVGKEEGGTVPESPGSKSPKRRPDESVVRSFPDYEGLKNLSARWNKPLFKIEDERSITAELQQALDRLPPVTLDSISEKILLNRYTWLLLPGILLFVTSFFFIPIVKKSKDA